MAWKNSNFQIQYFLLGEAGTVWEKYRVLKELLLDREVALKTVKASALRQQAKIKAFELATGEVEKLNAQADIEELEAGLETVQRDIVFATQERDFIQSLIDSLKPELEATRIKDYSDEDMFQAVQSEEWLIAIKSKIRRELACTGTLNPETLHAAMNHPLYEAGLLPYLKKCAPHCSTGTGETIETGNLTINAEEPSGRGNVQ